MRIAAQLYTVRDLLQRDFAGTLARVEEIGYDAVEFAGFGSLSAVQVARILRDVGLIPSSSHFPIERLESDMDGVVADALALGIRFVVCPYVPEERRRDERDWLACAALLNQAGLACQSAGLQLCYHHHSFEFERFGARTALQLLLDETDADAVRIELDTYWIRHGGDEPAAWIERLGKRCALLHLKDMARDAEQGFAPVGEGILEWSPIFAAARAARVEWGIVEQDVCAGDPLDSLARSLSNLRKWRVG